MGKVRDTLKRIPFLTSIYHSINAHRQKRRNKRELKHFKKHYQGTMAQLQTIFAGTNRKFFFAFGTLLGIIRDHKLLDNDMDIDMIAYCKSQADVERLKQELLAFGLKVEFEFYVDEIGIVQHAFRLNKIRVDVHYCFAQSTDQVDYVYVLFDNIDGCFQVAEFSCPHSSDTIFNFQGIDINIPDNPELFIQNMYGDDWRIPNKNYKFTDSPCVRVLNRAGHCTRYK